MASKPESIGFGVIGSGFMGRTYTETISKYVDGAHMAGVTGGTRAHELASDYGVESFESCQELVDHDGIDAVMIATPHALHYQQALAAAEAGKHTLIEKPMACTVDECDKILAACNERNLNCTIAFSQRTRVCNAKAKELLDSGKLGRVQHIRTYQMVPGGMPNLPKWQMERENIGVLFGHAIHNFDLVRWLTGGEIQTVYAQCRSLNPTCDTEGTSDVLMKLTDGATAYLFCSFQIPAPGFPRSGFAYRVICEKGLLDVDAYGEARASVDGGEWGAIATQSPIDWQGKGFLDPVRLESYTAHLQDFTDSIRENRAPAITGWDGRQAVAAALAAYESSENGTEVPLTA